MVEGARRGDSTAKVLRACTLSSGFWGHEATPGPRRAGRPWKLFRNRGCWGNLALDVAEHIPSFKGLWRPFWIRVNVSFLSLVSKQQLAPNETFSTMRLTSPWMVE